MSQIFSCFVYSSSSYSSWQHIVTDDWTLRTDCAASCAALGLPFLDYTLRFSQLDGETLKSLFWIGANYYHPADLPDTTELNWREAIIRCLKSVYPWYRPKPDPEHSPPPLTTDIMMPDPPTDGELWKQSLWGHCQLTPWIRSPNVRLTRGVSQQPSSQ